MTTMPDPIGSPEWRAARNAIIQEVLAGRQPLWIAGGPKKRKATKKEVAAWAKRNGYVTGA